MNGKQGGPRCVQRGRTATPGKNQLDGNELKGTAGWLGVSASPLLTSRWASGLSRTVCCAPGVLWLLEEERPILKRWRW